MELNFVNVKAPTYKIFLSGLIDLLIFIVLAITFNEVVMNTPISRGYKSSHESVIRLQDTYKLETGYAEKVYLTDTSDYSDYIHYQDGGGVYVVKDYVDLSDSSKNAYIEIINESTLYKEAINKYQKNSILLVSLVIGVSEGISFLLIPLLSERRTTIGKLIFKIRMVGVQSNKKIPWYMVFIHFLILFLGLSVLPYILFGEIVLLFVPLILFAFVLFTKNHQTLPELITFIKPVVMFEILEGVKSSDES